MGRSLRRGRWFHSNVKEAGQKLGCRGDKGRQFMAAGVGGVTVAKPGFNKHVVR